jgi:hypothetical protein
MAVEEVHVGPRVERNDPKAQKPKSESDPGYWEQKKAEERSKREFLEEKKMIDDINSPPQQPAPPFQVKGEVNLGSIDVQEAAKKAEETAAREREASQQRINELTNKLNQTTEELHNAQLQQVSSQLSAKIETLQQAIAGGSKKTILEQLAEVDQLAEQLGYTKPAVGPTNGDPTITLEIKKLEMQMAKDDREFKRQMKKDDREWELRIEEIKQNRLDTQAKLEAEREKQRMWAQAPERIGAVIAKGLVSEQGGQSGHGGGVASAAGGKAILVTANVGEAGEFDCPTCGSTVAIGPTARGAVCAKCQQKFTVKRGSATPPQGATPSAPPTSAPEPEEE